MKKEAVTLWMKSSRATLGFFFFSFESLSFKRFHEEWCVKTCQRQELRRIHLLKSLGREEKSDDGPKISGFFFLDSCLQVPALCLPFDRGFLVPSCAIKHIFFKHNAEELLLKWFSCLVMRWIFLCCFQDLDHKTRLITKVLSSKNLFITVSFFLHGLKLFSFSLLRPWDEEEEGDHFPLVGSFFFLNNLFLWIRRRDLESDVKEEFLWRRNTYDGPVNPFLFLLVRRHLF